MFGGVWGCLGGVWGRLAVFEDVGGCPRMFEGFELRSCRVSHFRALDDKRIKQKRKRPAT